MCKIKYLFKSISQISLPFVFQFISYNCHAQQNSTDSKSISNLDSTVKIYFDANANVLNKQDSINASYYRVIKYREGRVNGSITDYFKNGNPYMTGYYTDNNIGKGYENGKFTYYFENGNIFQVRNYINGVLDGVFLEFYPSGSKKASVSFVKGNRYGCEYAWDENGKIIRRAFIENNQSYDRVECDTTYREQKIVSEEKIKFKDSFNREFSEGEYKGFDNIFYYKTNSLRVQSISLTNDQGNKISPTNISLGQHFYVRIIVGGLISKNEKYKYILSQAQEDTDGVDYGGSGDVKDEGKLDPLWVELGGGILALPEGIISKDFYFSFKIKDRNSDAIIHGFFKFTIVR